MAAVAASLVAQIERTEPHAPEADAALAAICTWGDGARLTGRYFSDLIYSDDERGALRRLSEAAGEPSEDGWNALTTATMYVAWLVYQETGEPMPSDVNEVGEDSLDLPDSNWPNSTYSSPQPARRSKAASSSIAGAVVAKRRKSSG